jgi:hypothetical protein
VHNAFVDAVDTEVPPAVEDVPVEADEGEDDEADGEVGFELLPHPTKPTATTEPMNERTSRRLKGEFSWPLFMATPECKR